MSQFTPHIKAFINQTQWIYARTMPQWSHEYIVRSRFDESLFVKMVQYIREHSYQGYLALKVDDDMIEIQAKVAYWGSRIERIELTDEVTKIDIARNPRFPYNNSPYIYLVVFLTGLFPLLKFTGVWSTLLIVILVAAYLFYVIKYDNNNRHNFILIKERK